MFNAETTIEHTLNSIKYQSGDFEVLIVDDGSTDSSASIVHSLATRDSRFRLVESKKNEGHGPARNKGIAEAIGEYLVFVDADDELLPGALESICEEARGSEPDLLFIGCVEKKRESIRPLTDESLLWQIQKGSGLWNIDSHPELLVWPAATWAKVYKREFINRENIVFPGGFHQDIPWSLQTTLKARSISSVVANCYLYVRRGAGSSTTNLMSPRTLARIEQVKRVRESVDFDSLLPEVRAYLAAMCTVHLLWGLLAAYRTVPENLRFEHFEMTAAEHLNWTSHGIPGRDIRTEPLFDTRERISLSKALAHADFARWQKAMESRRRRTKLARLLDLSRYTLFSR
jgi:glycosyltransferase involved in cell wall biosynthesis